MAAFRPLIIQFGDLTYGGEWTTDNVTVWVRCAHGQRLHTLAFDEKPLPVAETLLFEMLKEARAL